MPATSSSSTQLSPVELSYLHSSLSSVPPIRSDGRTATQFRTLTAETDILPSANGSAHLSFSDGSEATVGVKVEVGKTESSGAAQATQEDVGMDLGEERAEAKIRGRAEWVELSVDIAGLRDDDPLLVFLSEMLREGLLSGSGLADRLVINKRWHFKLYIDVRYLIPSVFSFDYSAVSQALKLTWRVDSPPFAARNNALSPSSSPQSHHSSGSALYELTLAQIHRRGGPSFRR